MSDHEDCSIGHIYATYTQDLQSLSFIFQSLFPALSCDQKKKEKDKQKNTCKNIIDEKLFASVCKHPETTQGYELLIILSKSSGNY